MRLNIPLTRQTIADEPSAEFVLSTLDANRAVASQLGFVIPQGEWKQMRPSEKISLAQMYRTGVGFSLSGATSLRIDFSELEGLGFQSVRVDATRYLRDPVKFTDFHAADVAPYLRRFHMELVATGIIDEQQLLTLFEDGVSFAQGPHIARPGPVRADLVVERGSEPALRRVEV